MDDSSQIDYFYDLSVVLTGYNLVTLYGTGVGDFYFKTLQEILGEDFVTELLTEFEEALEASKKRSSHSLDYHVEKELLKDPKWGPVCRNIIKMWYMGNWYQLPAEWREQYVTSSGDVSRVLSTNSYIEGLVWKAMKTHPAAAKQPGWDTWGSRPPSS